MKHRLFLLVSLALASCSPLRIAMDTTESDGTRTVLTSNQSLARDYKGTMDIALAARTHDKDTLLAILITVDADSGHGIFNEGNQLKFRLCDDSVISLKNLYDKEFETKEETHVARDVQSNLGYAYAYDWWTGDIWVSPYQVNSMVPRVYTTRESLSYALYLVSRAQLQQIMDKGVKKCRVEIENDDIDLVETSGYKDLFTDMYQLIYSTLRSTQNRKPF